MFPVNSDDFEPFHGALEKLVLNDASLFYESRNHQTHWVLDSAVAF